MGDRFIRWYRESGNIPAFSQQAAAFARCGITIRNPSTGSATVINVDGDDVPVDIDALAGLLALRVPSVSVNWWISPNINVVSEFTHEPLGCEIQTFWLDGLDFTEIGVVEAAITHAMENVPTQTRALVGDIHGITDAGDWDSFVLYEGSEIPGVVDSLILESELAGRVISSSAPLRKESVGEGYLTRISAG
ncbi:hypothetical protein [Streptomyces sp. NPDC048568]|uniref:hypothetical protein n=1 Tax=Streptomyces sp. NPDC048568 TaxID=3365571 RepID=UPI003717F7A2